MRSSKLQTIVKSGLLSLAFVVVSAATSSAQTVSLTATRQTMTLPDGNTVPMWGLVCGTGANAATAGSTCTAMNGQPQSSGPWQPPLIVVSLPVGNTTTGPFTINLSNALPVETSLVIMGQLPGGGLGAPVREASPRSHATQTETTWTNNIGATFTPAAQGQRVRSFAQEAAPNTATPVAYTWPALKPGTYLISSGTYPSIQSSMGLYGVLVVTTEASLAGSTTMFTPGPGTAYPNIKYDADVPLLLSELDPVQNTSVEQFLETSAGCPTASPGTGTCSGVITAAAATTKWTPACGTAHTCYPPAVNYTPLYYMVNGQSFDITSSASSAAPIPASASTGNVLLRFVNAGSRMHAPSVNGLTMSLIAEDGNPLPDVALAAGKSASLDVRVQNDVFLPAGKVYDVIVHPANNGTATTAATAYTPGTYVVFDRELSLSSDASRHDSGMQTILSVGGAAIAGASGAQANPDFYYLVPGQTLSVTDPGKGVVANDLLINGVHVLTPPTGGTLMLNPDGTFVYVPNAGTTSDSFTYYGNNNNSSPSLQAKVTLGACNTADGCMGGVPKASNASYTSNVASLIKVNAPGLLGYVTDPQGHPLTASLVGTPTGATVTLNPDGGFTVARPGATAAGSITFQYQATNSQGTASNAATVTVNFLAGSGLQITVQDAQTPSIKLTDYKWIIQQDLTFQINAATQVNNGTVVPPTLGTNFHTSYNPVVAVGCTGSQSCEVGQTIFDARPPCTTPGVPAGCSATAGQHILAACDGSGICYPDPTGAGLPVSTPAQVNLPTSDSFGRPAYYYISILPGDAANAFNTGNVSAPTAACFAPGSGTTATGAAVTACGHTMGGVPVQPSCTGTTGSTCTLPTALTVKVEPNPLPTAQVTVYVFEDDNELNGEIDAEPGAEPGLEDFNIELWDTAGGTGDLIGQMTYDMFNEPLTNALNGMHDPLTGLDACPISNAQQLAQGSTAINGSIIVCPHFESDGKTISPLEGQAVIKNLMPGRFSIIAHPGVRRESRGEEWVQTATLDGGHFLDSFIRAGEPSYFQEYSPAGFHVSIGFANPAFINYHLAGVCAGLFTVEGPFIPGLIGPAAEQDTDTTPNGPVPCKNTIKGQITNLRTSRPPDERLYDSGVFPEGDPGNRATFAYSNCYVSLGVLDNPDLAFAKCDAAGNFTFTGIPDGEYSLTVFDQWLDQLMFEKEVVVSGGTAGSSLDVGTYPVFAWDTHIWNSTYMDLNGNGIQDAGEPGLIQIPTRIRFRNGKFSNTLLTDIDGKAQFNETFALFNWFTIETDTTRFRATGVHTVYDDGGPADSAATTTGYPGILNSVGIPPAGGGAAQLFELPANLRFPGSVYCNSGDCSGNNFSTLPSGGGPGGSTGRIDPGTVTVEGIQSYAGQNLVLDWGKQPYVVGENGGIRGHVTYSSTRPFDDPQMLFQNLWEPLVPNVIVNLYQEGTAEDGTITLKLIDTTMTSSWDSWAQGFRTDGVTPNMNCPGQPSTDPFFSYTLYNTPNYLNPNTALPNNSLYKCYDGQHNFNQIQPASYDGLYQFPTASCANTPGATFTSPSGQTITCATVPNPAYGGPPSTSAGAVPGVLPPGKYVVEAVTPPGFEIVKEEDKNILIGDNFVAPVTQQFGAISNIFIVPDQATVTNGNPSYTGPSTSDSPFAFVPSTTDPSLNVPNGNIGNPTTNMGRTSDGGFGPGGLTVQNTPCVGAMRVVPDFMSISPQSGQVAPFAGATRALCDRKEVTLNDQMQGIAEFFVWTKTPAASSYTGFILDDMSSEFDPNSPDFGEKFAVPNLPVSIRDPFGVETSRVVSDQWGIFDGLTYSTWEVNPPNPAGYAPNMMITCMNDPGPIMDTRTGSPTYGQLITDPNFNPLFSDFCYENPFMPADVDYLDTPVVPVAAFAEGYNPPDCNYPDLTPAILRVDGDTYGPWVSAAGHNVTVTSLGTQSVANPAYSGPAATTAPYNEKFITRHYGFGSCTINAAKTACTNSSNVTIGGVAATIVSWADTKIVATVPSTVPLCALQQRGHTGVRCGELVINVNTGTTAAPVMRPSINTVTVTAGGNLPKVVNGENSTNNAVQSAIDAATPGDLIIVNSQLTAASTAPAGTNCATSTAPSANCLSTATTDYPEMLIFWKPVRLQGVGSNSVTIDANAHPAGKLDKWRAQIDCLFGLNVTGYYLSASNPFDPTNTFTCPANMQGMADPIPDENITNWDASLNGFVAEVLQEPTLMGALEGAALTAVGKGCHSFTPDPDGTGTCVGRLTNSSADCAGFPTDYQCNPARVDGLSFTNSSAGGGGMFLHGYQDGLEISNNHVFGNGGNFSGGIDVGQLEVGSLTTGSLLGVTFAIPYGYNRNVKIHNNAITGNASFGDEFNTDTPAAGGAVTFCSGSDGYLLNGNWICGNYSGGDGGGISHYGYSEGGTISNNWILLNQSFNQTLPTNGGGITIQGLPSPGNCEGPPVDTGCPPTLTDGSGDVTINNNIIMGNIAEAGNGGGIRLQLINGTDVQRNPNNNVVADLLQPWWSVTIKDNVIADNVAGWAGGGISIRDAVNTSITNNTIASNDVTNTAGVEFDTVGANQGSIPPPNSGNCGTTQCNITNPVTTSTYSPAGIVSEPTTPLLLAAFGTSVRCPVLQVGAGNVNCTGFSNPFLSANILWQNRAFHIDVSSNPIAGLQNVVTLVPQLSQTATGVCPAGTTGNTVDYWELGVLGDNPLTQTPGSNSSGFKLNPVLGDMTSITGYTSTGALANVTTNPGFTSQYCNGSRVPPEIVAAICTNNANARGCSSGGATGGIGVPPGIPDLDPFYPLFTLNPAATVDEGNNWINLFFGPLSLSNGTLYTAAGTALTPLGNYNHSAVPLKGVPPYQVNP